MAVSANISLPRILPVFSSAACAFPTTSSAIPMSTRYVAVCCSWRCRVVIRWIACIRRRDEDGAKLRADTTVVQTDIHHPTDNTLLWDVVRVVTRLDGRLARALKLRRIKGFCDRTRAARRRMYEIQRMTTRERHEQQTRTYRVLIDLAEQAV